MPQTQTEDLSVSEVMVRAAEQFTARHANDGRAQEARDVQAYCAEPRRALAVLNQMFIDMVDRWGMGLQDSYNAFNSALVPPPGDDRGQLMLAVVDRSIVSAYDTCAMYERFGRDMLASVNIQLDEVSARLLDGYGLIDEERTAPQAEPVRDEQRTAPRAETVTETVGRARVEEAPAPAAALPQEADRERGDVVEAFTEELVRYGYTRGQAEAAAANLGVSTESTDDELREAALQAQRFSPSELARFDEREQADMDARMDELMAAEGLDPTDDAQLVYDRMAQRSDERRQEIESGFAAITAPARTESAPQTETAPAQTRLQRPAQRQAAPQEAPAQAAQVARPRAVPAETPEATAAPSDPRELEHELRRARREVNRLRRMQMRYSRNPRAAAEAPDDLDDQLDAAEQRLAELEAREAPEEAPAQAEPARERTAFAEGLAAERDARASRFYVPERGPEEAPRQSAAPAEKGQGAVRAETAPQEPQAKPEQQAQREKAEPARDAAKRTRRAAAPRAPKESEIRTKGEYVRVTLPRKANGRNTKGKMHRWAAGDKERDIRRIVLPDGMKNDMGEDLGGWGFNVLDRDVHDGRKTMLSTVVSCLQEKDAKGNVQPNIWLTKVVRSGKNTFKTDETAQLAQGARYTPEQIARYAREYERTHTTAIDVPYEKLEEFRYREGFKGFRVEGPKYPVGGENLRGAYFYPKVPCTTYKEPDGKRYASFKAFDTEPVFMDRETADGKRERFTVDIYTLNDSYAREAETTTIGTEGDVIDQAQSHKAPGVVRGTSRVRTSYLPGYGPNGKIEDNKPPVPAGSEPPKPADDKHDQDHDDGAR